MDKSLKGLQRFLCAFVTGNCAMRHHKARSQGFSASFFKTQKFESTVMMSCIPALKTIQRTHTFVHFKTLVLGLVMALCGSCSKNPQGEPPKTVEVEVVRAAPFEYKIGLTGVVRPVYESILCAKSAGAVDIHVSAGCTVKKGEVIASIQNAEAAWLARLAEEEYTLLNAQYERTKTLQASKTMSRQDLDTRLVAVMESKRRFFEAQQRLKDTQFVAPFDGTVGVFKERQGAMLKIGQELVSFYQTAPLILSFGVPEPYVPFVHKGQTVHMERLKHGILERGEFPIQSVQPMIDSASHMAPAHAALSWKDCVIGAYLPLELTLLKKDRAISLPVRALIFETEEEHRLAPDRQPTPLNGAKHSSDYGPVVGNIARATAYVVEQGKALPRPVLVGEIYKKRARILTGLKEGERVVSKGVTRLYPGMDVRIKDAPSADQTLDIAHSPLENAKTATAPRAHDDPPNTEKSAQKDTSASKVQEQKKTQKVYKNDGHTFDTLQDSKTPSQTSHAPKALPTSKTQRHNVALQGDEKIHRAQKMGEQTLKKEQDEKSTFVEHAQQNPFEATQQTKAPSTHTALSESE